VIQNSRAKGSFVPNIANYQGAPSDNFPMPVHKRIERDRLYAFLCQQLANMATYVARPASYQDFFHSKSVFPSLSSLADLGTFEPAARPVGNAFWHVSCVQPCLTAKYVPF
jgi:hypothetical protein